MHEARDCAANCARCRTLGGLTNDCASGTTCCCAHNTTRRRTGGHTTGVPTFRFCRFGPCHTLVDVPLRDSRSNTH